MDEGVADEMAAQAGSPDVAERVRAAARLADRHGGYTWDLLARLLHDVDAAVCGAAASTLLARGDRGWDLVLDAVWRSDDVGVGESLRAAFVDLLVAGDDVESELVRREQQSSSPAVQRGAREMLMALDMRPVEVIDDEDET